MTRNSDDVVVPQPDAAPTPAHALSLNRDHLDRLVEAAGVLVSRDERAFTAQPEVVYFRERLASSRALLAALHRYQRRTRSSEATSVENPRAAL